MRRRHQGKRRPSALLMIGLAGMILAEIPIRGISEAPSPPRATQVLFERSVRVDAESEVTADLRARAEGANWGEKGREAAVLQVFINERYHQDVILFAGDISFRYSLHLGRMSPGSHTIRLVWDRARSAPRVSSVYVEDFALRFVRREDPEFLPLAHAPILYARPNSIGRFTDIPLLMWYEMAREQKTLTIRYSVVFSNEDGGTETNALMARWGRATDIEWVYEVSLTPEGRVREARYQGPRHRTRRFRGRREGDHPLLLVLTDNNNFSDRGRSPMRFALRPIPFDASAVAREEAMDQNPWTYRLMAEELKREGKLCEALRIGQCILDPRRYLYIEATTELRDARVSFAVKLAGNPIWYTSNLGLASFALERNGHVRTTIPLPEGASLSQIERLLVRCDALAEAAEETLARAGCLIRDVRKVFFLDSEFRPNPPLPVRTEPVRLRIGEMREIWP